MRHRSESGQHRRTPVVAGSAVLLVLAMLSLPAPAEGQVMQLLRAVANGGSWINLPVEKGRASFQSPVFPLAGLSINGCLHVWSGHSGSWTVRAKDTVGGKELNVTMVPGTPARFDYKAGLQAQLDLEVEWSEPRDTTLFMWVGLARGKKEDEKKDGEEEKEEGRDICRPAPS